MKFILKKDSSDKGESFVLLQTIPQILEQKWIILVRQKNSLVTALWATYEYHAFLEKSFFHGLMTLIKIFNR